jgi:ubiquinone/menaquinone biosynthesis C-methylase UbiE
MSGQLAFQNQDGSYDFVVDAPSQQERAHFETTYENGGWWAGTDSLDDIDLPSLWAGSQEYLRSLGELTGKSVLLIGNGTSVKELLFVTLGAHVTITDLSFQGVVYAKRRFRASSLGMKRPTDCEFHAVNAYYLPFEDNTFDVVCGDAVIHHMRDLTTLFRGIHRCLKPGGYCRFLDTAYSPLWQLSKRSILRPLQKWSHKKHGISPEDKEATERGGYTWEELVQLKRTLGFRSVYYRRTGLLDYLLWRARCKLNAPWLLSLRPATLWTDRMLAKTPIMKTQGISLVFGFDK